MARSYDPQVDIVTWNVNSLRARLPRVLPWLEAEKPDVVCFQETKVVDGLFPREPFEDLGYQVVTHGQKTYNGVAILSKVGIEDIFTGFPDDEPGAEARVLGAIVGGDVMLLNLYVVNGREVGDPKYAYKLKWLEQLHDLVDERYDMSEKVVLTGDFNITFDDRDVHDPDAWRDKVLCSEPERDALARIMGCGFSDAFRKHNEEPGQYTWWDFRSRGWQRKAGMRIDHFLMSPPALDACTSVHVALEARDGPKPSDHAPVVARMI